VTDHNRLKELLQMVPSTVLEAQLQEALMEARGEATGVPDLDAMDEEHAAWRELCKRLVEIMGIEGHSLNEPMFFPMFDALRYWGEALVRLRRAAPEYVEQAYAEAKQLAAEGREGR
jgi:hypothetical protein